MVGLQGYAYTGGIKLKLIIMKIKYEYALALIHIHISTVSNVRAAAEPT